MSRKRTSRSTCAIKPRTIAPSTKPQTSSESQETKSVKPKLALNRKKRRQAEEERREAREKRRQELHKWHRFYAQAKAEHQEMLTCDVFPLEHRGDRGPRRILAIEKAAV
jgi:hypothetical protein